MILCASCSPVCQRTTCMPPPDSLPGKRAWLPPCKLYTTRYYSRWGLSLHGGWMELMVCNAWVSLNTLSSRVYLNWPRHCYCATYFNLSFSIHSYSLFRCTWINDCISAWYLHAGDACIFKCILRAIACIILLLILCGLRFEVPLHTCTSSWCMINSSHSIFYLMVFHWSFRRETACIIS